MKATVFLGGEPPCRELAYSRCKGAYTVCADGAAGYLAAYGIKVDCFVGDLDSTSAELARAVTASDSAIHTCKPEKDLTDGQLAMQAALRQHPESVTLLGALGGRLDHTLENLRLLYAPCKMGIDAVIEDEKCLISMHCTPFAIDALIGTTVSVLPYSRRAIVNSQMGLKYPMDALVLKKDDSFSISGISNVVTGHNPYVALKKGTVLLIINK